MTIAVAAALPSSRVLFFNFGVDTLHQVNFYADTIKVTATYSASGTVSNLGGAAGRVASGGSYSGRAAGAYTLSGRIYKAAGMPDAKLDAFYRDATQAYPQHRALAYDYAEHLIEEKKYANALQQLEDRIGSYPNDARLYELQARTYAALGKPQEEHHALAYNYILHGNLRGAIEQLQLAKQSGNDYYQLSIIESELKQFREMAAAQAKQ